jgi:SAM-dependent methyltransferase
MNPIEYTRMYAAEDRHWWYVGLHELILTTIQQESRSLARPLVIFDAGCGTGRLVQLMGLFGHRVEGCDASEEALRLCRLRGIETMTMADLNASELESGRYDVITSIDVLYHKNITDDSAVMRRLLNGLKPGGILILNLVAHEFLRSTHDIAVHTRERYTRKGLCKRLVAAGFGIEFATYRVSLLFPFIAVFRLLSRFTVCREAVPGEVASDVSMPHRMINALLLKTMRLENIFLGWAVLPFGSSVFVVARKQ